jgi:hypothetical protein
MKARRDKSGHDEEHRIFESMKELLGLLKALQEFMRDYLDRSERYGHEPITGAYANNLRELAQQCVGDDMTRAIGKLENIVNGVAAQRNQKAEAASGTPR